MVGIARKTKGATADKSSPAKEKAAPAKKAQKKVSPVVQFMRRFTKDTPGTLRFEGISLKGEVLKSNEADVTQLYVQRSSKAMGGDPRFLKIEITVLDKLPDSVEDED